jgi:hypothetical protein
MRLSIFRGGALVAAGFAAGAATAQPADATRGIEQLRQRMNPSITQKPPSAGRAPGVEAPQHSAWAKLRVGLDEGQVASLLGAPDRVERLAQAARWHWDKGAETGWVEFAGEPPRVREWRNR